ncbi:MAG: hypothetical protein QG633_119 [Patescibacteria group bacterium]|jgi:hypothetical protein|nr:hypothetical protein [Patescibacteria group bacterium]
MTTRRLHVPVGENYSESIEKMAKAECCPTEYLVSLFVEEFLLQDSHRSFLLISLVASDLGHNVSMTEEVQEKLAQFKLKEGYDEPDPAILRAIIENRVRRRRKQEHEAAAKK